VHCTSSHGGNPARKFDVSPRDRDFVLQLWPPTMHLLHTFTLSMTKHTMPGCTFPIFSWWAASMMQIVIKRRIGDPGILRRNRQMSFIHHTLRPQGTYQTSLHSRWHELFKSSSTKSDVPWIDLRHGAFETKLDKAHQRGRPDHR
jgi:hypothetical protein